LIVHVDGATWVAIPFASTASTRKVCEPTARPAKLLGLVHAANALASS
jgi:hypothetical protein